MTTKGRSWKVKDRRGYDSRPSVEARKQERRAKVLELIKSQKTIKEICRELHVDRSTVTDDRKALLAQGHKLPAIQATVSLSRRRKWVEVIQAILVDVLPYFNSQDITPSLRAAYYRLRALGKLQNLETEYNNLKTHTKEARLKETDSTGQRLYPVLPIDCFADETRKLIPNYDNDEPEEVKDSDEYVDDIIEGVKDSLKDYDGRGREGGRWYNQPEYVEVWIEKFADSPTFEKWLEDKDVNIAVNKGYSSLPFLWENIVRLKEKVKKFGVKHVHVLYFGDFDPSGEDMVKSLQKYFRRFGLSPSIIKKVALTQKQIQEYHIPLEPAKESDNRYEAFKARYGSKGAEIDAFIATAPDALKKIVQDSVDEYFDQKIYDEMVKKYKTSTPVDELKLTHKDMIYRIKTAFVVTDRFDSWDTEVKDEWDDLYKDLESEQQDDDSEDEDDE